jgi:hypothetical protein
MIMKKGAPYQTLTMMTLMRAHHGSPSQGTEVQPKTFSSQFTDE